MNLDELYFKNNFTKEDNKTNLEVNKLTLECLESKNNTFKLDEMGNLRVNSISTIGPKPDIVSQKGAIYLSSNSKNPSEYFGGIWWQKKTNSLFGENIIDKEFLTQQSSNTITISASESNAVEYNIEGKCEQEGESSPNNPIEIKTIKGIKNLLNIPNGTYINNGITAIAKDGIINVSGTANGDSFIQIIIKEKIILNGKYTLSSNITSKQNATTTELIRLRDENFILGNPLYISNSSNQIIVENKRLYLLEIRTGNGKTVNYTIKPQLEVGNIAHSYVPYGSWLKSKMTGKNLFNANLEPKSYYYNNNGLRTQYNDLTNPRLFINQKITTECFSKYFISFKKKYGTDTYIRICEYKKDNTFIKRTLISTNNYLLDIDKETNYIIICVDECETYYFEELMIVHGEIQTEYEPYKENEILIDMNKYDENKNIIGNYELNSINDVKDTLEVVSGHLEKKIGKIVLDGTEQWGTTTNSSVFYIRLNNYNNRNYQVISNKYPYAVWGNGIDYATGLYKHESWDEARLFVKNVNYQLIPDFKTYLSEQYANGTPVTIYYELAEPEEIKLTPTNILLFEGENNITLESDIETNTELKYKPYLTIFVWERISE